MADIRALAESLRRRHDYCDDPWYSCPKAPDGCSNDSEGPDCNCGADAHNATVDALLAGIDEERATAQCMLQDTINLCADIAAAVKDAARNHTDGGIVTEASARAAAIIEEKIRSIPERIAAERARRGGR